jgi:ParB-like chromosome segregation protein Spo0J
MMEQKPFSEGTEWRSVFVWIEVEKIHFHADGLHWNRISPQVAGESLESLARMRPYTEMLHQATNLEISSCRERIANVVNENGQNVFSEKDLHFFDLYFRNQPIKIDKIGENLDLVNGRHRLTIAKELGFKEVPVLLGEKFSRKKQLEDVMGNMELSEIEEQIEGRGDEAEVMENEIEQHKNRAKNLGEELSALKSALSEVGSDELREAHEKVERAQEDTKIQLDKLGERRDQMLAENKEIEEKLIQQNEQRRKVRDRVARLKMMFDGASTEFKDSINQATDALNEDLKHFADAQSNLREVRSKLEGMDFNVPA